MTEKAHLPVLATQVLEFIDAGRDGIYVDCTLGLAGHALAILERNPRARLIGLDRDALSLEIARTRLRPYAKRVTLFHADFRELADLDIPFDRGPRHPRRPRDIVLSARLAGARLQLHL